MEEEDFNWLYIGIGIGIILFIIAVIKQYLEHAKNPEANAFRQI